MSSRSSVSLFLAVALVACSANEQNQVDTAKDIADIRAAYQAASELHAAANAEGWAAQFEPDGIFLPPDAPAVTGTDSVAASVRRIYDTHQLDVAFEVDEIEVLGDWAFSRDHFSQTLTPKAGGPPIRATSKEIVIWRRQADGSWKVARAIFNNDAPMTSLVP